MPKIVILFFVALAGGLGACLLVDVSWGVYLYQLNYFLYPRSRWWASYIPDLRYSYIIGAVLVIAYILQYRKYTNNNIFEAPQSKWLLLDALNFAFISAWAVWPEQQFKFLEVHFKLLVFLFIAYKVIDTPEKFERMMWAFLAGCFYTGWFAHDAGRTPEGRLEGFGPPDCGNDGNLAAIVLVVSIPILIFYLIKGRNWQRFISLLFLAYIMDAIVLVNSRGAFVGLAASIGYLTFFSVIFSRQPSFMQRFLLLGGIFTGIGVFLYLADHIFWDRMFSVKDYA